LTAAPEAAPLKAKAVDAEEIAAIIDAFAGEGRMLKRPIAEIYDHLRDFYVYKVDGSIAGICALHIWGSDLGELRSLAVRKGYESRGIGSGLVTACMDEAGAIGLKKVFALTYAIGFFKKLDFDVVDKTVLPQKIWGDCNSCKKFPDCDETAIIKAPPGAGLAPRNHSSVVS
jgi:amino-acid N-acetyltransferase